MFKKMFFSFKFRTRIGPTLLNSHACSDPSIFFFIIIFFTPVLSQFLSPTFLPFLRLLPPDVKLGVSRDLTRRTGGGERKRYGSLLPYLSLRVRPANDIACVSHACVITGHAHGTQLINVETHPHRNRAILIIERGTDSTTLME